ncbi:MAG: LysM peptidoglycan-binding domain-containing protein [Chloroflexi bacterium]|nr:LysM peptidoglycan-binding domain-containing protein [Chloroflexota bacterium]
MKNWKLGMGCLVFLILLLAGGGAALWLLVPEVEEQLPVGASPIIVTLSAPANGAALALNGPTTIEAQAFGAQPIIALELWIDGVPSQAKSAPPELQLKQLSASWLWLPVVEGEHVLLARALAADQQIATSNAVRVSASKNANVQLIVAHPVQPGETLQGIAKQYGTTPQEIIDANPPTSSGNPVTPGGDVNIPIEPPPPDVGDDPSVAGDPNAPGETGDANTSFDPGPPSDPSEEPSTNKPSKYGIWIGNLLGKLLQNTLPTAPTIKANAIPGKCDADIRIADKSKNEAGFVIYRLDPNSHVFQRVATLDANGDESLHFVDKGLYGKFQYYVAAFNAAGESPSNIVNVKVADDKCLTPEWQSISLEKTKISVTQPVDKMYCYLSVNKGPWTRVPPGAEDFLQPKNGEVDLSKFIKKLAPPDAQGNITLNLECWGWRGNALVNLGEASTTINANQLNKPIQFGNINYKLIANVNRGKIDLSGHATQPSDGDPPPPPSPWIDPPTGAKFTTDPEICAKHGHEVFCDIILSTKTPVLVWDWKSLICISSTSSDKCDGHLTKIDGYYVYETVSLGSGFSSSQLLATISNDKITLAFLPKDRLQPPPGIPVPQYSVRAFKSDHDFGNGFKGEVQSADSKLVSPPQNPPLPSPPKATVRDYRSFKYSESGASWGGLSTMGTGHDPIFDQLGSGEIVVGFDHLTQPSGWVGSQYQNIAYRGAVRFNLNELKDKSFTKAELQFRLRTGVFDTDLWATNQVPTCLSVLYLAQDDWTVPDYKVLPPGDVYKYVPNSWGIMNPTSLTVNADGVKIAESENFSIDVTSAVRDWAQGVRPNYGFVFGGADERFSVEDNNKCWSIYGPFGLSIK